MKITNFEGQYRFLSNFFPVPQGVMLDNEKYPTVEHAYQAAKTVNEGQRRSIQSAPRPGIAKTMGRQVVIRDGWGPEMKLAAMEDLLRQKFSQEPLRTSLIKTDDAELEEGNDWGDRFWGVFKGTGANNLGKLIMKIRADLQEAKAFVDAGSPADAIAPVIPPEDGAPAAFPNTPEWNEERSV